MDSERSYYEMQQFPDFASRLEYLKLTDDHTQSPRHMSYEFFQSKIWKAIRKEVIDRDGGFDLGVFGMYIDGPMYAHHINPIAEEDIVNMTPKLTSLDNLICASMDTHNAIHYKPVKEPYVERRPGDTKAW